MDAKGTVVLKPLGDVELWFAEADDCSWRLPLHIEWKQYPETGALFALVLPAVCFYAVQLQTIQAMLGPQSLEKRTDRWLLPKNAAAASLRKAPGIHAEFYYLWPGGVHPPIPSPYHAVGLSAPELPPPRRVEHYRSLAEFIARERGIPADVTLVVLTALSQLGARWMLEYRKVLDLGFVRLVALPFRINWKEIVSFKCRPWKLKHIFSGMQTRERDKLLKQLGLESIACSVHNVGLRVGEVRRLDYTIEAIPQPSFEKTANTIEAERMAAGRTSYVAYYEEAVELFYNHIVEALANYIHKVHASWASVSQIGKSGVLGFLPVSRWRAKVRGIPLCDLPAHIIPPVSNFSVTAEGESCPLLISEQTDEVQEVPALPPPSDDVRESDVGGDVGEPRPEGTDGVPLLDAGQGDAPGQPVFPSDSTLAGDPPRMERE